MRNACWSTCVLLLLCFILTCSCAASHYQITSRAPSIHDGDASTKLISTANSHFKVLEKQSGGFIEVESNIRPFGGRKLKAGDESATVEKSSSDDEDHVKISSTKIKHRVSPPPEGDMKRASKYEASKQQTTVAKRIRGCRQFKSTDMDSFVAYADYPGPRHHPPKNN